MEQNKLRYTPFYQNTTHKNCLLVYIKQASDFKYIWNQTMKYFWQVNVEKYTLRCLAEL